MELNLELPLTVMLQEFTNATRGQWVAKKGNNYIQEKGWEARLAGISVCIDALLENLPDNANEVVSRWDVVYYCYDSLHRKDVAHDRVRLFFHYIEDVVCPLLAHYILTGESK